MSQKITVTVDKRTFMSSKVCAKAMGMSMDEYAEFALSLAAKAASYHLQGDEIIAKDPALFTRKATLLRGAK